jgi:hypothetical protein
MGWVMHCVGGMLRVAVAGKVGIERVVAGRKNKGGGGGATYADTIE